MGIGIIILLAVVIVAIVIGSFLYVLAARGRAKKLDPEGDKVEGVVDADAERHPEHVAVANDEQRQRYVGSRE
jgi:hypothetical protein